MEIKIKIEAPGLEGAIHTLAQVLGNFDYPVNMPGSEKGEVQTSPEPQPKQEQKKEQPKKQAKTSEQAITLETVRGKMVELARAGQQPKMKEIIESFGADKLSDIPEDKYPEVIKKVEAVL